MRKVLIFALVLAGMTFIGGAVAKIETGTPPPSTPARASERNPDQGAPEVLSVKAKQVPPTASEVAVAAIAKPLKSGQSMSTPPLVCYDTGASPGLAVNWGTSPANQKVHEHRHWCGYLNWYQTSRTSDTLLGGGYLCTWGSPQSIKVGGGNGYFSTDVESTGYFHCIIPYAPALSVSDAMIWRCNMGGYCNYLWSGRL